MAGAQEEEEEGPGLHSFPLLFSKYCHLSDLPVHND